MQRGIITFWEKEEISYYWEGNYFLRVEMLRKFRHIFNRKGLSDVDIF
jgi:hypothetical protein